MNTDVSSTILAWFLAFILLGVAYKMFTRSFIGRLIIGSFKLLWTTLVFSFDLLTNIFKNAYNQTEKLRISLEGNSIGKPKAKKCKVLYLKNYRKRK